MTSDAAAVTEIESESEPEQDQATSGPTLDTSPDAADSGLSVLRMAAIHGSLVLAALALFAIADLWQTLGNVGLAGLYAVVVGILTGSAIILGTHEWFHYFGARLSEGKYSQVSKPGLFVYNWDFEANSTRQFMVMSVAGTVGSIAALWFIIATLPADSSGRIAVQAAAWGNLAFSAFIEWPVLYRVRKGMDPLASLGRIDRSVLYRSASGGLAAGIIAAWLLA